MRLYFGVRSPIPELIGLADVEPGKPAHRDVLLQLRDVLRDQVLDGVLWLPKVWLLQQDSLLDEALDLTIDPLGDCLRRRAILLGLALVQVPLLDEDVIGHVVARNPPRIGRRDLKGYLARQLPEILALGDEVRLAVHLDQHPDLRREIRSRAVKVSLDHALAGRAAGPLGRLGDALFAQYRVRLFEVCVGLLERVLAVHHAGARHLAELLDELHWYPGH